MENAMLNKCKVEHCKKKACTNDSHYELTTLQNNSTRLDAQ